MQKLITSIFSVSALFLGSLNAGAVSAGEMIDRELPADGVKVASIDVMRGDVEIIGTSGSTVSVKGELDDKAEKFLFEKSGNHIRLRVKMPNRHNEHRHNDGSRLTIKVPDNIKVNFQGVSTEVSLTGLANGVDVETVSGDIKAENLRDRIELTTVSGDLRANDLDGRILLSTVNGSIKDKSSSGRLHLKAVSGDIESNSRAKDITIGQVSGDVEFDFQDVDDLKMKIVSGDASGKIHLNDDGNIKITGVSSDLDLSLQKNVNATFKLSTSAGGKIRNSLTADKVQRAKYGPSSKLYFSTGDGSASVKARVVSGRINIKN